MLLCCVLHHFELSCGPEGWATESSPEAKSTREIPNKVLVEKFAQMLLRLGIGIGDLL